MLIVEKIHHHKAKAHPLLNLTEMVMDLGKETTLTLGFCENLLTLGAP